MNRFGNEMTYSKWYEKAKNGETLGEYPRPSMVRQSWVNLNGLWEMAITKEKKEPESFDRTIMVPFSPEAPCSGGNHKLMPNEFLWYRRSIEFAETSKKYILHFGAVDQICDVYLDGKHLISHEGGYLPFEVCILPSAKQSVLTVCVQDKTDTSWHARGKQKLKPSGMFYTAQSGIWQSVWMEPVPETYIKEVNIRTDGRKGEVRIQTVLSGADDMPLVSVRKEGKEDEYYRDHPEKGIADFEEPSIEQGKGCLVSFVRSDWEMWSTENPKLYHITVTTKEDRVDCYFAMRELSKQETKDGHLRFFLNGKLCMQSGVLDQGYWPESLLTPPCDEAIIYDIERMKALGFNMIRKHIKVEPERWYYHCDRLGMLVWQDMINGGSSYKAWFVTYLATVMNIRHIHFGDGTGSRRLLSRVSADGRKKYLEELKEMIRHLHNHPSIVCWVPFNESWGQFDSAKVARLVAKMDPSRWVDHASGWFDQHAGDVNSLHYYFFKLHFKTEKTRVTALTEFGGYTYLMPGHIFCKKHYGYGHYKTVKELTDAYRRLWEDTILPAVRDGVSGLVYTQLSDIEEEANGILTYDRMETKLEENTVKDLNKRFFEMIME